MAETSTHPTAAPQREHVQVYEKDQTVRDWHANYYHPIAEKYYDRAVARMLALMRVQPGQTILDAGCGTGVHSVRCARAGCRVHAVDVSQTMLHAARERIAAQKLTHQVTLSREDVTALSFPDQSFDHVFNWGVIIHIADLQCALHELARVLRPGGSLALYVTNLHALDHRLETLARWLLRKPDTGRIERHRFGFLRCDVMNGEGLHTWRIDARSLTDALQNAGLQHTHHLIGEFTEIQRHLTGPMRKALLHLNNLCYRAHLTPRFASSQLLIFRKPPARD